MIKKTLIIVVLSLLCGTSLAFNAKASDSPAITFRTLYEESFEKVVNAIHDETVLWANDVLSGVKTTQPIEGNRSLHYVMSGNPGDFVTVGGTTATSLQIQGGTYRVSMKVHGTDVDFFNIKVEETGTWQSYNEFLFNPLNGKRLDGNGNEQPLGELESLIFNDTTKVSNISFVFDARQANPSNLVFIAKIAGANPLIIIDDFKVEIEKENYVFKDTVITNFNQASGALHENTIFWLQDGEGTAFEYTEASGVAIDNRSLVYIINKTDFDVLGGSQGQKLTMKGGHTYQIDMDVRLIDVSHFVVKVKKIDGDVLMHEMYFNQAGQRLPGSMAIKEPESISHSNGVTHVKFEFKSLIDDNAYLFFEAKSTTIGSKVVIDNVEIREEVYDVSYQTFTSEHSFDFEGEADPFDQTGLKNGSSSRAYGYTNNAISGQQSLTYQTLNRFQWHELVSSDSNILTFSEIQNKIHIKARFSGITNVKMSFYENGQIIHEMYFHSTTLKRTQTYGKAYLDQGKLVFNEGNIYVDYRLPELDLENTYEWKLSVYAAVTGASVIIDDLTFMKLAPEQIIDENLPVQPPLPGTPNNPLPTGVDENYTLASMLSGSTITEWITYGVVSIVVFGISTTLFIVFIKKDFLKAKKLMTLILFGITGIGVPLGGLFGFMTFDSSINDVLYRTSANEYQYIYPEKLSGNLNNPGMGWVALEEPTYGGHPDMGTSGSLPEVSNISLSTSWARIEKEEGIYDWTLLDQIIDYYVSIGKRINFRIATDTLMLPNTYNGTPDWLFNKYNVPYQVHNYTDPGPVQTYKVVDTRNVDYQRHLRLFLEALAEKYQDNPMIDVVEIRGWGNWGEWHSGYEYPTMNNRMKALQDIINEYAETFENTGKLLVLSAAWDPMHMPYESYEDYIEWSAFDYAMRLDNVTFRRDSGGNLLNYPTDERLLSDFFRSGKRLPLLGEYASGISQAYSSQFGFDLIGGIDDILYKMRPNYSTVLGWVNSAVAQVADDGNSELWQRGNEKLGFRLAVDYARTPRQAKQGTEMDLMFAFSNSAVGRFWYRYPLKMSLLDAQGNEVYSQIDSNFDARTFVLGDVNHVYTKLNVPNNLANGNYTLAISIVDELGNPAIRLGMAGEIEERKVYSVAQINIADNYKTPQPTHDSLTFDEAKTYKFEPKQTYAITVDYTPSFDVENYYFGDTNGYVFALTSRRGGPGATVGYQKWQDVSQERGTKTFILTTQGYSDYVFNLQSEGFDDITVNNVKIEKMSGYYEHFESYDFTDLDAWYLPVSIRNAEITTDAIAGSKSLRISSNARGDSYGIKLDTAVNQLKPNTTYTVSFKFLSTALIGKGGYMFLNLLDEGTQKHERIGEWYERMDRGVTTQTFTFTTNDSNEQTIVWGVRNGGAYVIDDITIIAHPNGTITEGTDYGHEINERPNFDFPTFGETEGFEYLSFNESAFDWGQFGWGQFTYDQMQVISGNSSLFGKIEVEALHNEWFEFARSKPSAYPFEANESYQVTFKYRILKNPNNNGFFYILMRDMTVGLSSDVGFTQIPAATVETLGTVQTLTTQFTLSNHQHYSFIFGMHMQGEIVIDDVIITKTS
ncbi:DUF4832 domain-containing protein [Paracholeplasma manati]|uniref:DUF4832 domain-containing protein n=1 Tax=Paracholeplasma manati TaxID=591373 RepID=UPI002408852F|nr:DUF4832 domain-containing protein [Paracholeplasma manati]MDG0888979.1 DUF4832 domain-containing protein [Paracholeplasma manati]